MRRYIPDLITQTKDTDPDLRFMALNDLEKEMSNSSNNISPHQRMIYGEVLLRCLDDEFSEVRTQALKCFESLTPTLGPNIINIIKHLSNKKPEKISITSTIYTMAIHNILKNLPTDEKTDNEIIKILLIKMFNDKLQFFSTIDYIEILIDMLEYLGKYMSISQLQNVINLLIESSYDADTIIAKKSVTALNLALRHVNHISVIDQFFANVLSYYSKNKSTKYQIITLSILGSSVSANRLLISNLFQNIWSVSLECLHLNLLNQADDDYDKQQELEDIRIEAISVLSKSYSNLPLDIVENYVVDGLNICFKFIDYDPYGGNEDEEEKVEDLKDDIYVDEYSDYEEEIDDDDDDDEGFAWKLRRDSILVVGIIINHNPISLPIIYKVLFNKLINQLKDKNSSVVVSIIKVLTLLFKNSAKDGAYYSLKSFNSLTKVTSNSRRMSDISMQNEDDPFTVLVANYSQICGNFYKLLNKNNADKIGFFYEFVTDLSNALEDLEGDFLELFIVKLNELNETGNNIETVKFYSSLLKYNSLQSFGNKGLNILVNFLTYSLNSGSHELILDSLSLLYDILSVYVTRDELSEENLGTFAKTITPLLIEKTTNKNFSTEIRQKSLNSICALAVNVLLDPHEAQNILKMFTETINIEFLVISNLVSIAKIINSGKLNKWITSEWSHYILKYLVDYLSMNDLRTHSLRTIESFAASNLLNVDDDSIILNEFLKLDSEDKFSDDNCVNTGIILKGIVDNVNIANQLDNIMKLIVDLNKLGTFDEKCLPSLTKSLLQQADSETLINAALKFGKQTDLNISKILAVLSVSSGKLDSIGRILDDLNKDCQVYFSIVFLEQVSKSMDLNCGLQPFLRFFDLNEKEGIQEKAIIIVSTICSKNPGKYLPQYLNYLKETKYLIPSFKCLASILTSLDLSKDIATDILNLIFSIQSSALNLNEQQYTLAAECLSTLVLKYSDFIEKLLQTLSDPLTSRLLQITIASTIKFTFGNEKFLEITEISLLSKYLELTTEKFAFDTILLFKQIGISNLIIGIHKKPMITIPLVSKMIPKFIEDQMDPKKEYIRVVQIGPFKHKLDDALNFRKLIYELIYSLLNSMETHNNLIILCNVNWADVLKKFLTRGLKDDQSIVSICLLTILKIFALKPTIFTGTELMDQFITSSNKILNKKLKDEAPKQDIEKRNDLIKTLLRFLKKVDVLVENSSLRLEGNDSSSWTNFFKELKAKYPVIDTEDSAVIL